MINFSKYKFYFILFSVIGIILFTLVTFGIHKGFAHSLDFNGGLRAVIDFDKKVSRKEIEKFFSDRQIETVIALLEETKSSNHYQIDIGLGAIPKITEYNKSQNIAPTNANGNALQKASSIDELIAMMIHGFKLKPVDILSADQVGAIVGGELTTTGFSLLLGTLAIMTLYLSFRFQFKFALGASVALIHDIIFTIAFIGAFQIKPSVPIIAALLTLMGYSINDTIVIFDRIRENTSGKVQRKLSDTINLSINQTLNRTMNTSFSTLISIVAIVISGAMELYDFAIVLIFGIFIGTYSSIFIAAPIIEFYDKYFQKKEKDGNTVATT